MKIHQNYVVLVEAFGYALLVLFANMFLQTPAGLLRMGFAIALYLISRDTLASAGIAKGPRTIGNPDRWMLVFYLALFFGAFMLLALWRGMGGLAGLLPAVAVGSVVFGVMLAFMTNNKPHPYTHHFQTEKPMLLGKLGLFLYYMAPPLKLAAIWFLVHISPPTPAYLFFYIILIGFAFPRYRRKSNGNVLWANFPALLGYLWLMTLITLHL